MTRLTSKSTLHAKTTIASQINSLQTAPSSKLPGKTGGVKKTDTTFLAFAVRPSHWYLLTPTPTAQRHDAKDRGTPAEPPAGLARRGRKQAGCGNLSIQAVTARCR